MKYGICSLSVVPGRAEPSDKSEMVTQLLFGEVFSIYEEKRKGWKKIKTAYDNYECWIDEKQVAEISEEEYEAIYQAEPIVSGDLLSIIKNKNTGRIYCQFF